MNRVGFIGGSDVAQIMRGDWHKLWLVKTGREESEDLSDKLNVQLGIHTEGFNLGWFEKKRGVTLTGHQRTYSEDIDGIPAVGTIDAMTPDGCIVEAKHSNAAFSMEKILEAYMPQVQTYMRLSNSHAAHLSVIFGNSFWDAVKIEYDEEYFEECWKVVKRFWSFVQNDEAPHYMYAKESPSIDHILVDDMVRRDASMDNAFIDCAHTYLEHEDAARTFENAKKDLKAMVGSNERVVYSDIVTIKRDKRGALRITKGA